MPDNKIKEFLEEIRNKTRNFNYTAELESAHKALLEAVGFDGKLIYAAAKSLSLWGYLFLFSMITLPISEFLLTHALLIVFVFLFSVAIALWKTGRFIQKWCLSFDAG